MIQRCFIPLKLCHLQKFFYLTKHVRKLLDLNDTIFESATMKDPFIYISI